MFLNQERPDRLVYALFYVELNLFFTFHHNIMGKIRISFLAIKPMDSSQNFGFWQISTFPCWQKQKTSTFFHSGGHKTNFNALFSMLKMGHICCSFAFVLVSISIIKRWRVKGTLSIKILVLWPPELKFCCLKKKIQNLKFYMINRSFGQNP